MTTCLLLQRRRQRTAKLNEEASKQETQDLFDDEFEKGTGPKRFRYGELAVATDNFSDKHKLGEGGFGSLYRGFLQEIKLHVAIKRVSKSSKQGRKEYASEVRVISRLRHRNLVQLIGWCHGGGELLLVYELMPNGSLDKHPYGATYDDGVVLPWPLRRQIVLGLGSALLYLHEEWEHDTQDMSPEEPHRERDAQATPMRSLESRNSTWPGRDPIGVGGGYGLP
jgi:hypothetical protein